MQEQDNSVNHLDKQVIKGTSASLSGNVIGKVFSFVFQILLARFFGPENYGLYSISDSIISITKRVASLGIDVAGIVKLVSVFKRRKDEESLKGVILSAIYLTLASSIVFMLGVIVLAPWLANKVFNKPEVDHLVGMLAISIPFYLVISVSAAVAQALRKMKQHALLNAVVIPVGNLLAVGISILTDANLLQFIIYLVLINGFTVIPALLILNKLIYRQIRSRTPRYQFKRLLDTSLPVTLVILSSVIFNQSDKLVLGAYVPAAEVGIYNGAYRIVWTLQIILLSFHIFPSIVAELYDSGEMDELKRIYSNIVRWVFTLMFPMFLLFEIFPEALLAIFGSEYRAGVDVMRVLAFFPLISGLTAQTAPMLRMTGNQRLEGSLGLLSMFVNVGLSIYLVRIYGSIGVAAALIITIFIKELLKSTFIYLKMGIHPYNRYLLRPMIVGLVSSAAVLILQNVFHLPLLGEALLLGSLFILIYGAGSLILLPRQDLSILRLGLDKIRKAITR